MRELARQSAERARRLALESFERVRRVRFRSRKAKIALGVLVLLVGLRLALPSIIEAYVNDRLASMDGYTGRVEDVDVALWRGAYRFEGLVIRKLEGDEEVPFVDAPRIDIGIEWMALFDGAIVATLEFDRPTLNFVGGGRGSQSGAGNDWRQVVDDLVPITINRLEIHDGAIHYHELDTRPAIDVAATGLEVVAENLSTVRNPDEPLPARLDAWGTVQSSGALEAHVRLDPWAEQPTFDLDLSIERLRARELNPFLREHAGVDAEEGRFFLYTEITSNRGRFRGYVKPMARGLSVFQFGESGGFVDQVGDALVQLVQDIFENHGNDTFATRVPVSGTFENWETDGWEALLGVLSNAFIEAISHGVENEVGWRVERRGDSRGT